MYIRALPCRSPDERQRNPGPPFKLEDRPRFRCAHPGYKQRKRSAERRIHPCPRGAIRCCHLKALWARKRPDVGGRSPSGAPQRRLPERPNAPTQPGPRFAQRRGRRHYPRRRSRLSGAPRAPVIVPEGTMPGPPENGVTSPARRNRTRSIVRLSPATSLR
jgi:hypothetical protein